MRSLMTKWNTFFFRLIKNRALNRNHIGKKNTGSTSILTSIVNMDISNEKV